MKLSTLFVLFLIVLISSINAQTEKDSTTICTNVISGGTARTLAMGNSKFLEDVSDIFVNPAYGFQYSNIIWGDIGDGSRTQVSGNNHNIGVNVKLFDSFTLGAILTNGTTNKEYSIASLSHLIDLNTYYSQNLNSNTIKFRNNITLFSSYKYDNITYGLGFSYFENSGDTDYENSQNNDYIYKLNQIGFNAGALITLFDNYKFDVSGTIILNGTENEDISYKNDADKITASIVVKTFVPVNNRTTIIPLIEYSLVSDDVNSLNKAVNSKKENITKTQKSLLLGVGSNYKKGNLLINGGFALSFGSVNFDSDISQNGFENSYTGLNYNIGLEFRFTSWLIGRVGYKAVTQYYNSSNTHNSVKSESNSVSFGNGDGFLLGVGFRFGGFYLDATIDEYVIRKGLQNINSQGNTFNFVTLGYNF